MLFTTKFRERKEHPLVLVSIVLSFLLTGLVCAGQQPQEDRGPYKMSLDVDLVLTHVTVQNEDGQFISGIPESDFSILEDRVPQEIQVFREGDVPVSVGLVIDQSGSMRRKYPHVVTAGLTFVGQRNPEDEFFVTYFADDVSMGLPEGVSFSSDINILRKTFIRDRIEGKTALYDGLLTALEQLTKGRQRKKALLLISDGGDNSSKGTYEQVLEAAKRSEALIYTVGIYDEDYPERDLGLLKDLALHTGGLSYFPRETLDVVDICKRVANDLRRQYVIGYVPSNKSKDGRYRDLHVDVQDARRQKLDIRHRSGYYAPGSSSKGDH